MNFLQNLTICSLFKLKQQVYNELRLQMQIYQVFTFENELTFKF